MTKRIKRFFGFDMGGTLGKACEVDPETGELIGEVKRIDLGDVTSNSQASKRIIDWVKEISGPNASEICLGICAAGDVDEDRLIIKKSPNSKIEGEITFARDLRDAGYDVTITNDMRAAVQDSARFGEGKGLENVCTATYSEGHNVALARKKINDSQAEFGHKKYKPDGERWCGCGQRGHLEPYVSARGAAEDTQSHFKMNNVTDHPIFYAVIKRLEKKAAQIKRFKQETPEEVAEFLKFVESRKNAMHNPDYRRFIIGKITSKEVYEGWRIEPEGEPQRSNREIQVEAIRYSFGEIVSAYNPVDAIICMGGQTLDKDILFFGTDGAGTRYRLEKGEHNLVTLKKPKIIVTDREEIGIRGAVAYYLSKR